MFLKNSLLCTSVMHMLRCINWNSKYSGKSIDYLTCIIDQKNMQLAPQFVCLCVHVRARENEKGLPLHHSTKRNHSMLQGQNLHNPHQLFVFQSPRNCWICQTTVFSSYSRTQVYQRLGRPRLKAPLLVHCKEQKTVSISSKHFTNANWTCRNPWLLKRIKKSQ